MKTGADDFNGDKQFKQTRMGDCQRTLKLGAVLGALYVGPERVYPVTI